MFLVSTLFVIEALQGESTKYSPSLCFIPVQKMYPNVLDQKFHYMSLQLLNRKR